MGMVMRTDLFLPHLVAHAAFHLGQAGYVRRMCGDATSANPLPLQRARVSGMTERRAAQAAHHRQDGDVLAVSSHGPDRSAAGNRPDDVERFDAGPRRHRGGRWWRGRAEVLFTGKEPENGRRFEGDVVADGSAPARDARVRERIEHGADRCRLRDIDEHLRDPREPASSGGLATRLGWA